MHQPLSTRLPLTLTSLAMMLTLANHAAAQSRPDFNGDHYADIAIGVSQERVGSANAAGAIAIMYGGTAGVSYQGSQLLHQNRPGVPERSEANDRFGAAMAWGDFDGDGYDDLAIGVPGESIGSASGAGAVHVRYGASNLLAPVRQQFWHQNKSAIPTSAKAGDGFGSAMASGDFDGDGFDDLVIGVPNEKISGRSNAGMVHVLYGSGNGLRAGGNQQLHQDSPGIKGKANTGDRFGTALATGDFNNDGFADLAVGAPFDDIGPRVNAGVVNVIYGSAAGLTSAANKQWNQTQLAVAVSEPGDQFGAVLTVGDFNNDGFDDLAATALRETVGNQRDAGEVDIIYGSVAGLAAANAQVIHGANTAGASNQRNSNFAIATAAGDINGDGFDELIIGAPQWDFRIGTPPYNCPPVGDDFLDTGSVTIVPGSVAGLDRIEGERWTIEDASFLNFACGQGFGTSVSAYDHNNDGYADLIIGVPGINISFASGAILLMLGDSAGLELNSAQEWNPAGIGDGSADGPMGDSLLKR